MFATKTSQRASGRPDPVFSFSLPPGGRLDSAADYQLAPAGKDRDLETHWVKAIEFATD